jgi:hypothetical protein
MQLTRKRLHENVCNIGCSGDPVNEEGARVNMSMNEVKFDINVF